MKKLNIVLYALLIIIIVLLCWLFTSKINYLKYRVKYFEQTIKFYEDEVKLREQDNLDIKKYCEQIWWDSYYDHVSDMCIYPYSEGFTAEEKEKIRSCFEDEGTFDKYYE